MWFFFKITQNFSRKKAFLRNLTNLSALDIEFAAFSKLLLFFYFLLFSSFLLQKKFTGEFYFCTFLRNPTIFFCIIRQICHNLVKKFFSWIINWQVNVKENARVEGIILPHIEIWRKIIFFSRKFNFQLFQLFFQQAKFSKWAGTQGFLNTPDSWPTL